MPPRRFRYVALASVLAILVLYSATRLKLHGRWDRQTFWRQSEDSDPPEEPDPRPTELENGSANSPIIQKFQPGIPKPPGQNYTMIIVAPRRRDEDVSWLSTELPNIPSATYTVDDPSAALHPPQNKGHEAMVYLTYLIDAYDTLPDILIFIHAHQHAWHNNELLDGDTAAAIRHLSPARVVRAGYVNLRCQWHPGCPAWLRPAVDAPDPAKKEQALVAAAWRELYPRRPLPETLAQPCCSQFAVSRQRARAVPRDEYVRLRDWLMRTRLPDDIAGRVFEYFWQVVFAGVAALCVPMHECYCDGFGACFEDEDAFQGWFERRWRVREDERGLAALVRGHGRKERGGERMAEMERLRLSIDQGWFALEGMREMAFKLGRNPAVRARIAGREWKPGDGF